MIFGLDIFTLGVAFLLFAFGLTILWKIVWHTYHGDIGKVFILVVFGAVVIAVLLMALGIFVL